MPAFAAVVILYNPDEKVAERVGSYLPQVDKLYIFDNSENPSFVVPKDAKIQLIQDGINKGIAERVNEAALLALSEKFDFLLVMDQDSHFEGDNFCNYLNCIRSFADTTNVAVFGSQFLKKELQSDNCSHKSNNQIISSGSIINLKNFNLVGGFDTNLFIDQVDFAYCYQAALAGFKNILFENIFLSHSLGKTSYQRSLKNFVVSKRSLHPPIRLYYMTRNFFYIRLRFGKHFPEEIRQTKKDLLNRIKNNLLYGNQKFSTAGHIIRGYIDFISNRMGKKSG